MNPFTLTKTVVPMAAAAVALLWGLLPASAGAQDLPKTHLRVIGSI